MPVDSDNWKIMVRAGTSSSASSLNAQGLMPSGPPALYGLRSSISFLTPCSDILISSVVGMPLSAIPVFSSNYSASFMRGATQVFDDFWCLIYDQYHLFLPAWSGLSSPVHSPSLQTTTTKTNKHCLIVSNVLWLGSHFTQQSQTVVNTQNTHKYRLVLLQAAFTIDLTCHRASACDLSLTSTAGMGGGMGKGVKAGKHTSRTSKLATSTPQVPTNNRCSLMHTKSCACFFCSDTAGLWGDSRTWQSVNFHFSPLWAELKLDGHTSTVHEFRIATECKERIWSCLTDIFCLMAAVYLFFNMSFARHFSFIRKFNETFKSIINLLTDCCKYRSRQQMF